MMSMRIPFYSGLIVLVAFSMIAAGCIQPGPAKVVPDSEPDTTVMETPADVGTVVTAAPSRDLAELRSEGLEMDPTGTILEYTGSVVVYGDVYRSVVVALRYPDAAVYTFDAKGMGGSNPTKKEFFIYPDTRYQSVTPEYIIRLDGVNYTATYRYDNGTILRVATTDSRLDP